MNGDLDNGIADEIRLTFPVAHVYHAAIAWLGFRRWE
jgi:hypothetical protein